MAVLILAELNGNELSEDATAKAVSAAKELGEVHILCASSDCSGAAQSAPEQSDDCLLYTSPSPRDRSLSRMPSSA